MRSAPRKAQQRNAALMAPAVLGLLVSAAAAQNGRPMPDVPQASPQSTPYTNGGDGTRPLTREGTPADRRRPQEGRVRMSFNDVSVEETFGFIVETTGKVVMPVRLQTLRTQKVTLISDEFVDRAAALDLLFSAFRLNDIGVIEQDDRIIIGAITDIVSTAGTLPVLGPEDDVMYRQDVGNFVVKIFRLDKAEAGSIGEQVEANLPDYASLTVDPNSNQIMVVGDIGLMQHIQQIVDQLDNTYIKVKTKTYRLRYADASEIADNIDELFSTDQTQQSQAGNVRRSARRTVANARTPQQANQVTPGQPGPTAELRLTVNTQQNTVTVQADPNVIEDLDVQIYEHWDLPRPEGTSKTYLLHHTDAIQVRDVLQELLQGGATGGRSVTRAGGRGAAQGTSVDQQLGGIYKIEAYADNNKLIVLSKTEETFAFLDAIIESLDQPSVVGMPMVVELKHAEAVGLADEINVLLAEAGANVTLDRPDQGLSSQGISSGGTGGESAGAVGREIEEGGEIQFPWQGGRGRDDRAPETALIGKIRIVPIIRQNALAIVSPPPYQEAIREFVQYLDRPGRQVMISAVIAEVELTDDFALGLRVSSEGIPITNIDNALRGSVNAEASEEGFLGDLFDTSVLDVGFSANMVLQALSQNTNVRVIQEPRVFTADNQEAYFFDGQDVPFISNSVVNATTTTGVTQSFEYKQVGVVLNARPRITAQKDVDLEVYLELSSIVPGQTLFGGAIIDRRSTTTDVVIKDGQTIVLSGILKDSETWAERGVPFFGDLPLIGELFKSRERSQATTELIAFITPRVVEDPVENDVNFHRDAKEELLRELNQPLRGHERDVKQRLEERLAPGAAPAVEPELDDDSQVRNGRHGGRGAN